MKNNQSKDPLHGITLQSILEQLIDYYGFDTLGELIKIKCFTDKPSIKSS
ncbi:MAG: VF530 family DNA-binding protein, partial [Flavobacterium sp.]